MPLPNPLEHTGQIRENVSDIDLNSLLLMDDLLRVVSILDILEQILFPFQEWIDSITYY